MSAMSALRDRHAPHSKTIQIYNKMPKCKYLFSLQHRVNKKNIIKSMVCRKDGHTIDQLFNIICVMLMWDTD